MSDLSRLKIWAFALLLTAAGQGAGAEEAGKGFAVDTRTIPDVGAGQMRNWIAPPTVLVVYRDDALPDRVRRAIATIEERRSDFFGLGAVRLLDLDEVGGDILAFAPDGDELLLFGALTSFDRDFMRAFARPGASRCFVSVFSRDNVLNFGAVYV